MRKRSHDPETARPAPGFGEQKIDLSDLGWSDVPVFVLFWGLALVVFLQFFYIDT